MKQQNSSITVGVGMGGAIAAALSLAANHSILWAMLHTFLGWFYVIYRALGYGGAY